MWSIGVSPFWKNTVDEFVPKYGVQSAVGLFAGTWLVLGVYAHWSSKSYDLVFCNCNVGIWYDEEAETYATLQWRLARKTGVLKWLR